MDDGDDFFDFSIDTKREIVPIGTVKGRVKTDDSMVRREKRREEIGNDYADNYKQEEEKTMLEV